MNALLDLLGDYAGSKPSLVRTDHKRRHNTAELKLMSQISQLTASYCRDIEGFVRCLNDWLQTTSMGNSAYMWSSYIVENRIDTAEVWHTDVHGNKDRHVCTITVSPTSKML